MPLMKLFSFCLALVWGWDAHADPLKLAKFDVDASPPPGTLLTYDPCKEAGELTLRCRGICLLGSGKPVVVCAVDWIGVANDGHDFFRQSLAEAAGTTADRVAVQSLHQHDAPICDFTTERLLRERNLAPLMFDSAITKPVILRAAAALRAAVANPDPVSHVGCGSGQVKGVASNRRLLGTDGKVRAVRFTATKDPALRAEPEGTIDPEVSLVSFWNGDKPLAVLTHYATHPQSYYRTGIANPDFPGMSRFLRQTAVPGVLHVHFTGAGGNIGAGKYNDGSPENRSVLAQRLSEGMRLAWEKQEKFPVAAEDLRWRVVPVALPPAPHLEESALKSAVAGGGKVGILSAAEQLAWLLRCQAGHKVDISCLAIGKIRVMHLPGELFVEYQLAAKKQRPELFVTLAAYGDYGPGYIGTAIGYEQGGYETQASSSFVAPGVEAVISKAIGELLTD